MTQSSAFFYGDNLGNIHKSSMKIQSLFINSMVIILMSAALFGCANEQRPSGGPPDKEPPNVISFEPAQMTKNYSADKVTIEFSEYIQKATISENIFITPRLTYELDWSGRFLDIQFTQPLETNTTYTVSLGADYTDLRGNKPTESFSLTFSTGNSIDSGIVKGKIFESMPAGIYVFLYPLNALNKDTLNPSVTEASYITQTGSSGEFTFYALPDGEYRLMTVKDQYKDRLFSLGTDGFGTTWKQVVVNKARSSPTIVRCGEAIDIIAPALYTADPLSQRLLQLDFSEEIDSMFLKPQFFSLKDTNENIIEDIRFTAIYKNAKNTKTVYGILENALDTSKIWKIVCNTDIKDKAGNKIQDSLRSKVFKSIIEIDSTKPFIESISLRDSSKNISLYAEMRILFSTAVDTNVCMRGISLTDTKNNKSQALFFRWLHPAEVVITSEDPLYSYQWYEFELQHKNIRSWNGQRMKDSTQRIRFRTIDSREFGSIKGELYDSLSISGGQYILLLSQKNAGGRTPNQYTRILPKTGDWTMNNIPPGEYILGVFHDANNNGKYDFGTAYPYSFAERFLTNPVSVSVKSRWTVEGVKVFLQP